jgi:hypothetical protein
VNEADLHARHRWLIGQRESLTERLVADPEWFDARVAGWWCWGACAWIGDGWCSAESRKIPNVDARGDRMACMSPGRVAETMEGLARRLRSVRVACGDWSRVLCASTLTGVPTVGVYLDPPYAEGAADYAVGGTRSALSAEVRAWCEEHDRDPRLRIVLSGYDGEHNALQRRGWRMVEWKANGGYGNAAGNDNRHRERLWLSPHCEGARQLSLLGGAL